jgi:hypothetical protein
MGPTIRVTPAARSVYALLEPALQEELRERMAAVVDDPVNSLRRTNPFNEPAGMWAHEYESRIVDGLQVILFIAGLDDDPPQLVLTRIAHFMAGP